jgi:hypothetical protein
VSTRRAPHAVPLDAIFNDEDDVAYIYTAQRPIITKLKKSPAAVLIERPADDEPLLS